MAAGRQLFIVTGASGGYGSAILRQVNLMYGEQAVIIACGRNKAKVDETSKEFSAEVKHIAVEFAQREGIKERCQGIFDLCKDESFDAVVLCNNHGIIGDTTKLIGDFDDSSEIADYNFLNLTSFHVLTSVFLKNFPGVPHTCVNISSLSAIKEFPSMSLYCTGKAARLMLYKCLAAESKDVKVLSYSPGPMQTLLTSRLHVDCADENIRKMFASLAEQGGWVDPDESAKKMLTILKDNDFTSGEQLDFYDE